MESLFGLILVTIGQFLFGIIGGIGQKNGDESVIEIFPILYRKDSKFIDIESAFSQCFPPEPKKSAWNKIPSAFIQKLNLLIDFNQSSGDGLESDLYLNLI